MCVEKTAKPRTFSPPQYEDMASGFTPHEPSANEVVLSLSQSTRSAPNRPPLSVIYNKKTNGKFVSQLKSSIQRFFQKINTRLSLGFKVENATIEETTLQIKSQNGKTYRAVLKNGGMYLTTLFYGISKFSSCTLVSSSMSMH